MMCHLARKLSACPTSLGTASSPQAGPQAARPPRGSLGSVISREMQAMASQGLWTLWGTHPPLPCLALVFQLCGYMEFSTRSPLCLSAGAVIGQVWGVKSPADPILSSLSSKSASRKCSSKSKASWHWLSFFSVLWECLFSPFSCSSLLPSTQDLLRASYMGRS